MNGAFWIAIGMIGAAYFIGSGLKNFKNPDPSSSNSIWDNDHNHFWGAPELIREDKVHSYIGILKEDATSLVKDYPSIPHLIINGRVYFPADQLKKWVNDFTIDSSGSV